MARWRVLPLAVFAQGSGAGDGAKDCAEALSAGFLGALLSRAHPPHLCERVLFWVVAIGYNVVVSTDTSVESPIRCRRLRAAMGAQRKAHRAANTERIGKR